MHFIFISTKAKIWVSENKGYGGIVAFIEQIIYIYIYTIYTYTPIVDYRHNTVFFSVYINYMYTSCTDSIWR